ncbi:MAG TPA: hypothetical protein VG274_08065, partial [Rhizomicrobium sp.]|nr:hypothetical protein [Rhizomicrobium sp.]
HTVDPKFHVSNCEALQQMKRKSRFERYVVAVRPDGTFRLNLIDGKRKTEELRKLAVCQNCMDKLRFDGFVMGLPRPDRIRLVQSFTLDRFFEKFSKTLLTDIPQFNSDEAPLNDYAQGFSTKSNFVRAAANWTCQNPKCRAWLGGAHHRRFLHVHHVNGMKCDDESQNHRVLCIACHAEQPSHGHMKRLPEYKQFLAIRATL